ncbi:hypothetical protein DIZ81_11435 [Legionella taurinensis]|uniref:V-SNARE coiled-coil homology domain-containing protein n=1 Tax=Legionella taurinensis TaxID=70611 RepID=A0A3A5LFX4_9GAMM|nr:synaptobrevin family protein [Legionella taurinensis]MDX1838571.1 synaptobrevin family protein [Legionella taurinensis]PUT39017.1 hypothetical protein DB744_11445 [Legionella taurinensis]PUT41104.1 hypothetical protein DB746_09835 [Legionella taurinensis]PUT43479.1 hypothetical protein DB743_10840 [Legionella taurinensis]PUT46496.1 hypothetical protein DB745_10325 [Legionella taurinensis]
MKCYAIITRFEGEKATLHIPTNRIMLSLMATQIKKQVAKLEEIGEALEPGKYYSHTLGEMKIYGFKLGENYWAIACDSEITLEQQRTLTINLLFHKCALQDVAQDPDQFIDKAHDPKIKKVQKELDETHAVLLEAFQKMELRGEKLSELVDKTEGLSQLSFAFKEESERLNRCWPSCTLI